MENTILEDIMLATEESFTIGRQMYYMKTMKGFTSTKLEVRDSINNHIKKQIKLEEKAKEGVRKDPSLDDTAKAQLIICISNVCASNYRAGYYLNNLKEQREYWDWIDGFNVGMKMIKEKLFEY
jgi:hypothetical protein